MLVRASNSTAHFAANFHAQIEIVWRMMAGMFQHLSSLNNLHGRVNNLSLEGW